jgi:hypothetical protein
VADFRDDIDILNLGLTLELFETELYKQIVASGKLSGDDQIIATDFGNHEAAHVTLLTQAIRQLGGTPVAPRFNYPTLNTRDEIARFLGDFEQLGSGAYLNALPEIRNPDVLTAAVRLHNIEGSHASVWYYQLRTPTTTGAFAAPTKRADVQAFMARFIAGGTTTAATAPAGPGPNTAAGGLPATSGGGSTTIPATGRSRGGAHPGVGAGAIAGLTAIGAGVVLRARSHRNPRGGTSSPGNT